MLAARKKSVTAIIGDDHAVRPANVQNENSPICYCILSLATQNTPTFLRLSSMFHSSFRWKGKSIRCKLSGPRIARYRETISAIPPYCALWGFWCLNMANWVRYPLPLFSAVLPWRACEVEVREPPLKRGISAILARYPMKTRRMGAIPPSAILSRKGIARYGGVSCTGPLRCKWTRPFWETDCKRAPRNLSSAQAAPFAVPALRELDSACRLSIL